MFYFVLITFNKLSPYCHLKKQQFRTVYGLEIYVSKYLGKKVLCLSNFKLCKLTFTHNHLTFKFQFR